MSDQDAITEAVEALVRLSIRNVAPNAIILAVNQGLIGGLIETGMHYREVRDRMEYGHREAMARGPRRHTRGFGKSPFDDYYFFEEALRRASARQRTQQPPPPPPNVERWWIILGVHQNATKAAIRAAWRAKMKQHHPDRGGSVEEAKRFNMAKDEGMRLARA